ncbi:MAG: NlpC/P60 family protein [Bacteroidota bacterium]|jgi:cell wall-associated NlpC family hydrolase
MIPRRTENGIWGAITWISVVMFLVMTPAYAQKKKSPSIRQDTVKVLPFSAEVVEERKENDETVPQEEIDRVLAATRGFTSDKLSIFSASEQSKILQQIAEYVGVPYEVGGNSKDGIDCGSFVALVYKNAVGAELPRSSSDQLYFCQSPSDNEAHFGDLVFFNTTGRRGSHVGIFMGNQLFAHASVSIGVTISTLESSYYKKRFEGVRRLRRE